MLGRVFKKITSNITCNVIRKVYESHINWNTIENKDKEIILLMNDLTKELNPTKNIKPNTEDLKEKIEHLHKKESLNPATFLNTLKVEIL